MNLPERYAAALFDAAEERNIVERVLDETALLAAISSPPDADGGDSPVDEFIDIMVRPGTSLAQRTRILDEVLEQLGVSELTRAFSALVLTKKRFRLLPGMHNAFLSRYRESRDEIEVKVETAVELSAALRERLRAAFKLFTGKNVLMEIHKEPSLLAGIRARIGNVVLDGSLAARLRMLEKQIIGAEAAGESKT